MDDAARGPLRQRLPRALAVVVEQLARQLRGRAAAPPLEQLDQPALGVGDGRRGHARQGTGRSGNRQASSCRIRVARLYCKESLV